jgi:lipoyl(octanoyl) transferase
MAQKFSHADAPHHASCEARLEFYLFGQTPFEAMLLWQERMAYYLAESRPTIVVACCEHPPLISVGRRGSRGHILMTGEQLRDQGLTVRWVARGGGCILHQPGQLAVYTIAPLEQFGWTVGAWLQKLQQAVWLTLQTLAPHVRPGTQDFGVWGKSGQLAATGIAVRRGVSTYGVYINVNPRMDNYSLILTATSFEGFGAVQNTMGCLQSERPQGVRMAQVRTALIEKLPLALGVSSYHVQSSHPWLRPVSD